MIKYSDLEDLLDFRTTHQPILSLYLSTDRSRISLEQQKVTVKNLLREGRKAVEGGTWDDEVQKNIQTDLNRLERYLEDTLQPSLSARGLTLFACREANLWRSFELPRPVPSLIKLEYTPHIRPLTLILDEYHRYGALLLDRKIAELYEIYIGDILRVEDAFKPTTPAPLASLAVEHPGSGDRGISTHRDEAEMQKHFRRIADIVFHLFHRRHYEYLVLGGQQPLLAQFENYLHPSLQEKLVGRFPGEPGKMRPAKILEEVAALERKVEAETEKRLVLQLINTSHSRGLAVLGLEKVVQALNAGAVHILFIQDGWHESGWICRPCEKLGIAEEVCPNCGNSLAKVTDIVDDALESALRTGSIIEHVHPQAGLNDQGHIGAILRFKI